MRDLEFYFYWLWLIYQFFSVTGKRVAGRLEMAQSNDAVNSYKETFFSTKKISTIFKKLDSMFQNFATDFIIYHSASIFILFGFSGMVNNFFNLTFSLVFSNYLRLWRTLRNINNFKQ